MILLSMILPRLSNKTPKITQMTDPTTHGIIALAVLALLCGMRRRRTGPSNKSNCRTPEDAATLYQIEEWGTGR